MVSSLRINCSASTYIDKTHANTNYNKEKTLLCGIDYKNLLNCNIYKSLLEFDTSKLDKHSIQSAFLYLFIEKIKSSSNSWDNIIISKNLTKFNISTASWINSPKTDQLNKYTLNIPPKNVGKYIKFNITNLVQDWINPNENYGISIEPKRLNCNSLVQFASINSLKPPYLMLTVICHSLDEKPMDS